MLSSHVWNVFVFLVTATTSIGVTATRLRTDVRPETYLIGGEKYGKAKVLPSASGKFHHPNCECLNCNDVVLNARTTADDGENTYAVTWNWDTFCDNLIEPTTKDEKPAVEAKNDLDYIKKCEKIMGDLCRHECILVARLFDQQDFTLFPPTSEDGGKGYHLTKRDCMACMVDGLCSRVPRTPSTNNFERVVYGRHKKDVLKLEDLIT